jgi:hypothetical protein
MVIFPPLPTHLESQLCSASYLLLLVSCLAYSSILKMEATCSPEMSVDFQRITWRYIPDDKILHNHLCQNQKTYTCATLVVGTV